jgi:phage pi2 protein 07
VNSQLRFTISSPPDRDDLVADLISDNEMWAQINVDKGYFEISFYPNPTGGDWSFRLDDVESVIDAARERLIKMRLEPNQ